MKNLLCCIFINFLMSKSLLASEDHQRLKNLYLFAGGLDSRIRDFATNFSYHLNIYDEKFSGRNYDNARCAQDLEAFGEGLIGMEPWALTSKLEHCQTYFVTWRNSFSKVFDAYGKLQSGIMAGNFLNLGHFDQCINIQQALNGGVMRGQHCIVLMKPGSEQPELLPNL